MPGVPQGAWVPQGHAESLGVLPFAKWNQYKLWKGKKWVKPVKHLFFSTSIKWSLCLHKWMACPVGRQWEEEGFPTLKDTFIQECSIHSEKKETNTQHVLSTSNKWVTVWNKSWMCILMSEQENQHLLWLQTPSFRRNNSWVLGCVFQAYSRKEDFQHAGNL